VTVTAAPLLVVAPHQDDETFGCGGLIALKCAAGVPVSVVFLTDGSRCFGDGYPDPAGLSTLRRREALSALGALGVAADAVTFLDLPDGGLSGLGGAERADAVARLAEVVRAARPGEVCVPHRRDRHADHEAASLLTREAIAATRLAAPPDILEYLIWHFWEAPLLRRPDPGDLRGAVRVGIAPALDAKRRAAAAYASQAACLPRRFLRAATADPWELFVPGREGAPR
jgi:LmbE family N-acetylglucosaminyl deacetylase